MNEWILVAVMMMALLPAACVAQEQVVFSWTPGDAKARTQAGAAEMTLAEGAKLVGCPVGKGVVPNEDGEIGACEVKLGKIPEKGTLSIWLKPSRELRLAREGEPGSVPLLHCEDLTLTLAEGKGAVSLGVRAGQLLRNKKYRGKFGCAFTQLRANQWYHFAVTYNAPVKNAWRGLLYGVTQPEPWWEWPFEFANKTTKIELSGLLAREGAEPVAVAVGPITWFARAVDAEYVLSELKSIKGWEIPENHGEGLQVLAEPFDAEALGGKVIYENAFNKPLKKDDWKLEGPATMKVEDGRLVVRNTDHVTFWLKKKCPRDFVAAWDVQPSQVEGLCIVFISANGQGGKDLFDPTLKKRTGQFNQYVRGDLRSYHFSYYAGTRGSANARKNPGLYMMGMCRDIIGEQIQAGKKGPWRVAVARRGPRIDVSIDGRRLITLNDKADIWGPMHGAGYLGLRQMKRSKMVRYDNLVIRELKGE
jgi:hypothetical protein